MKDAYLRYYTMRGFAVWDQPGYDMHGLPIEVLVEKELGFRTKKDIESFGIDRFIERCREFAIRNMGIMTEQFKRLGVWMDWDNPYMTIKPEYIESEWWTFKRAWERGLVDRDYRVVHWCPRCETALAEHEIEYKELSDPSIYVKFRLVGRENEFIVIWTTTPWTLPANLAVMVHPDFEYAKVRVVANGRTEYWWLAKDRVPFVMKEVGIEDYEIMDVRKGKELDGWRYEHPLMDEFPRQREFLEKYSRAHTIVLAEFVVLTEGTGCVHSAPGHGEEDYAVGKEYGLPVYNPVGPDGKYVEGEWQGVFVKEADPLIIERLREKGLLIYSGRVTHRYPTCWRCKSPLLFRATEQWFLRVSKIKEDIIRENAKHVTWLPPWVKKRYEDGVRNVGDWVISRQRYWNAPIPIWVCTKCNHMLVIGSFEELRKYAKNDIPENFDPHRPWVDEIILRCPKCGGDMRRVPDVLDVWFDSAIASWASLGYPRRKDLFEMLWPADMVIEGQDQVLKWFYAQQVLSVVAFGTVPYKKVAMHGFVLDAAGAKMSKSLGNVVTPEDVIQKYGADVLRLYLLSTTLPWEDIRFKWDEVEEVYKALDILWNVFFMAATYMELDKFDPSKINIEEIKKHLLPEDRWLLSRANRLVTIVEESFENFSIAKAVRAITEFIIEDLSRWYGKLVRKRFWIEKDDPVKLAAYYTIFEAFNILLKVLAPFAPFIAEEIYQRLIRPVMPNAPESIHLCTWPKVEFRDEELEDWMSIIQEIASAGAAARQKAGVKIRWPLRRIIVETENSKVVKAVKNLDYILKDILNVKDVELGKVERHYKVSGNPKSLGPKYRRETRKIIEALKNVDGNEVKEDFEKQGKYVLVLEGKEYEILPEDVFIEEEFPDNLVGEEFRGGWVFIDVERTPELIAEGYARELVRRIQEMRKELDLDVEDRIRISLIIPDDMKKLLNEELMKYIRNETRAVEIRFGERIGYAKDWRIDNYTVTIGIEKINNTSH